MAEVFAAESASGARAAVKILHRAIADDPELSARFWREVRIADEIDHPGVVRVIDHGITDDGRPFFAMEQLEGKTLAELDKLSGGIALDALLGYTDQLLDTLTAAHARSVVHRDLKPANLFVTCDGRLKVLDFGIARLLEHQTDNLRTATGIALGTLAYMAPEQAAGRRNEIDGRTDIYAVGAILFRLLSGRRVHEGRNGGEMLLMTASRPAPPVASVAPGVPARLAAVVDRALAFDRNARFADARALRAALAEARAAISAKPAPVRVGSAAPVEPTVRMADRRPRTTLVAIGGLLLLVSALGSIGVGVAYLALPASTFEDGWQEQVELSALLDAYRRDPRAAQKHYGSQMIRTSGPITEARVDMGGAWLRLGSSEPWLQCWLEALPQLEAGTTMTIRGRVTAYQESPKRIVVSPCTVVR